MEIAFTFDYRSGSHLLQRHITICEVEKIKSLFNEGHGLTTISRQMAMGSRMVERILNKLELKRTKQEAQMAKKKANPIARTGRYASLK